MPAGDGETSVRIRMVNSDSIAVATFPTPGGRPEYRGDVAIAGVPGTAAPVVLAFTDTEGSATGALLPTGHVRDTIEGIEATCVDNGMPVVVAMAESFGLTGYESHEELAADAALLERIDAFRTKAGAAHGPGRRVASSSVPKTVAARRPARTAARCCTRSFIPVQPHTLDRRARRGQRGHRACCCPARSGTSSPQSWPGDTSQIDVEHPTGHLLVDVVVDASGDAAAGRPLRRRPHRPQALRRHRLPEPPDPAPRPEEILVPPLHDIAHLAHVELLTDKPEESLDFFVRYLGMTENGSAGDSVFLRAWDDYENTTIKLTAAPRPGVGRTNFRAASPRGAAAPGRRDRGDRPGPRAGRTATPATARCTCSPTRTATRWASTTRPSGTGPRAT